MAHGWMPENIISLHAVFNMLHADTNSNFSSN